MVDSLTCAIYIGFASAKTIRSYGDAYVDVCFVLCFLPTTCVPTKSAYSCIRFIITIISLYLIDLHLSTH